MRAWLLCLAVIGCQAKPEADGSFYQSSYQCKKGDQISIQLDIKVPAKTDEKEFYATAMPGLVTTLKKMCDKDPI